MQCEQLFVRLFGEIDGVFFAGASVVALLFLGENDMNGKAASNDFTYGIYADTQYVAVRESNLIASRRLLFASFGVFLLAR